MKRYLIFMFYSFNSTGGGACDFKGDADTKEEIIKVITEKYIDGETEVANIIDTKTGHVIEDFEITTDIGEDGPEGLNIEKVKNELDNKEIK